MVDEAHITTFAVHPAWRRQRIGERLLLAFLDLAAARHAREATLEVRLSNIAARRLYEKYGFRPVGLRPRYYSDNGEDALIMTTEPLGERALPRAARAASGRRSTRRRRRRGPSSRARPADATGPQPSPEPPRRRSARVVSGPLILAVESSCDETGIAARRGRPPDPLERRREPDRAPRRDRRASCPEVAARAHLRWIVPVLDEALGGAGATRRATSTRSP